MSKSKLEKPHCIILAGDLNAHNSVWYKGDNTDSLGSSLQRIFDKNMVSQMTNGPTYITNNSQTCLDLLVTDQPNIILKNEIHPSLHTNCSHQVVYTKVGINCPPPPKFNRKIWHYSRADIENMKRSALAFNWADELAHLNLDDQVQLFNDVIFNISENFIPNEFKTFNPKEPPWLTSSCKSLYKKYKKKFRIFARNNFPTEQKQIIDELKANYTKTVEAEKEKYFFDLGKQLADPETSQKKYWTVLKKINIEEKHNFQNTSNFICQCFYC